MRARPVSPAHTTPSHPHAALRGDLTIALLLLLVGPDRFSLYGTQASRPGGTTNAQARFLDATARSLFVHLEMAAAVRAHAAQDTAQLPWPAASFARSLLELLGVSA